MMKHHQEPQQGSRTIHQSNEDNLSSTGFSTDIEAHISLKLLNSSSSDAVNKLSENSDSKLNEVVKTYVSSIAVQEILKRIEYSFSNPKLLFESACHRSFVHEQSSLGIQSNERLEFLGDSVLSLVVSDLIIKKYPKESEGVLSKLRGSLVCESGLNHLALSIGLDQGILLGKGEINRKGYLNPSSLSDFFEALIGAIYQDSDFKTVKQVLEKIITDSDDDLLNLDNISTFDYKSKLQEWSLKSLKVLPEYKEILNDKENVFEIHLLIDGKTYFKGVGPSKKKLMKSMAKEIYIKLETNNFEIGALKCL